MSPTESTNLVGVATYLAEIGPDTDIVDLASDIGATFRADLADGLIQQSALNFGVAFEGTPPGLPPIVFCTDVSAFPIRHPRDWSWESFRPKPTVPLPFPLTSTAVGFKTGKWRSSITDTYRRKSASRRYVRCSALFPRSMAGSWSDLQGQPQLTFARAHEQPCSAAKSGFITPLVRPRPRPACRTGARPRRARVLWVAMILGDRRIPVSVSMRVRSSRLPSESRPYSTNGRSGSTVRRRIRLTCSATRRRSRAGHSSGGSELSSARNLLAPVRLCPVDWNTSANRLRCASAVNHGVPMIGV